VRSRRNACGARCTPAPLQIRIVEPVGALLDAPREVRHNLGVDPVVIALAQLVRDRWDNERRSRRRRGAALTIVRDVPA